MSIPIMKCSCGSPCGGILSVYSAYAAGNRLIVFTSRDREKGQFQYTDVWLTREQVQSLIEGLQKLLEDTK